MGNYKVILMLGLSLSLLSGCSNPLQKEEEPETTEIFTEVFIPAVYTVYDTDFIPGQTYRMDVPPLSDDTENITFYSGFTYQMGDYLNDTYDNTYTKLPRGRYAVTDVCGSDLTLRQYVYDESYNIKEQQIYGLGNERGMTMKSGMQIVFDFTNEMTYSLFRVEEDDYEYLYNGGNSYIVLQAIDDGTAAPMVMVKNEEDLVAETEIETVEPETESEPEVIEEKPKRINDYLSVDPGGYLWVSFSEDWWDEESHTYVTWLTLKDSTICPNPILSPGTFQVCGYIIDDHETLSLTWAYDGGELQTLSYDEGTLEAPIELGSFSENEYICIRSSDKSNSLQIECSFADNLTFVKDTETEESNE